MGVAGGGNIEFRISSVLSQKGPGWHCPPFTPEFREEGEVRIWDLGTCMLWKGAGVKISWSLLPPSEIVAPSPQLFFTFLKGILVF